MGYYNQRSPHLLRTMRDHTRRWLSWSPAAAHLINSLLVSRLNNERCLKFIDFLLMRPVSRHAKSLFLLIRKNVKVRRFCTTHFRVVSSWAAVDRGHRGASQVRSVLDLPLPRKAPRPIEAVEIFKLGIPFP